MGLMTGLKAFVAAVLGGIGAFRRNAGRHAHRPMETWISAMRTPLIETRWRSPSSFHLLFQAGGILGTSVPEKV